MSLASLPECMSGMTVGKMLLHLWKPEVPSTVHSLSVNGMLKLKRRDSQLTQS